MIARLVHRTRSALLLASVGLAACSKDETVADDTTPDAGAPVACAALFGAPGLNTGLDEAACKPECECGTDPWKPPAYDALTVEALLEWTLLDAPATPATTPYDDPGAHADQPGKLCSFVPDTNDARAYRLVTSDDGAPAGATTHTGACGLCSSLADLAVYIQNPDLTGPVRACGIEGISAGEQANIDCLAKLGFTEPCARIWYFNTVNTRTHCSALCLTALDAPYNEPDGALNPCLQCDEDQSGPVFKAVAGRTRRNSGLPSSQCRPCDDVAHVVHAYP